MTTNSGVWIDHHKAVVVYLANNSEETREILANGEDRSEHSYTPRDFVPENKRERKQMIGHNQFYDQVIAALGESDKVLVFGPGEAKGEFVKRLDADPAQTYKVEVHTTDKLTTNQIAEYVRLHFQKS